MSLGIPLALVREKGCIDCHPTDCPFSLGCPSIWVGWHSAELWCSLKQNLHPARCLALHSLKSAMSIPMTSCSPQCGRLIQLLTHMHTVPVRMLVAALTAPSISLIIIHSWILCSVVTSPSPPSRG